MSNFLSSRRYLIISPSPARPTKNPLSQNLSLETILERNSISSELADTLAQLVNSHWVLIEVESEISFVINVA